MENKIINTTETDNGFTIKVEIINFTPYGKTGFVEDFRTFMGKKGLNIKNTKEAYPLNGVYFTFVDLTDDQLNLIRDKIFEYNNDMEYNETINTNKLYTSINEFKQYNESMNEEDLYHDIDWIGLERDMTIMFNRQAHKLDYDTFVLTFATLKNLILQYKMTN